MWENKWNDKPLYIKICINFFRVVSFTLKNFIGNKGTEKAQSLTYYTILSVVPLLALVFGISKGFGIDQTLRDELQYALSGHAEVYTWLMNFVEGMLENTKGGTIAGFGLAVLFWSVMRLIGSVEEAFNNIWNVKKARSWQRKFTDYFSILLLAPVLIILSSSVTVFLSAKIQQIFDYFSFLEVFRPLVMFGIKLIPYVIVWMAFSVTYLIIPNTRIKLKPALIAGVVAGSSFQLIQWGYLYFQIGVSKYNAIYGSFAALPLFLIWLHLSWQIMLSGAELGYSIENVKGYINSFNKTQLNQRNTKNIFLMVLHAIVYRFDKEEKLTDKDYLHQKLELVPNPIIDKTINDLIQAEIISITNENKIVLIKDIHKLNLHDCLARLNNMGANNIDLSKDHSFNKADELFDKINKSIEHSQYNKLIKDIEL